MQLTHEKCLDFVPELQLLIKCYAIVPVFLELDCVLIKICNASNKLLVI